MLETARTIAIFFKCHHPTTLRWVEVAGFLRLVPLVTHYGRGSASVKRMPSVPALEKDHTIAEPSTSSGSKLVKNDMAASGV